MNTSRMRPSPALVVSLLALFVSIGGVGYAASKIGTTDLENGAVTTKKLHNKAVNGSKIKDGSLTASDLDESSLTGFLETGTAAGGDLDGTYPDPTLRAPEAWHEVGAAGEPAFQNGYSNSGGGTETVAFYKDREGIVHLKGLATGVGPQPVFQLPAGYRPASGKELDPPAVCGCTVVDSGGDEVTVPVGRLHIYGDVGAPSLDGGVLMGGISSFVSLDGVTFRAES